MELRFTFSTLIDRDVLGDDVCTAGSSGLFDWLDWNVWSQALEVWRLNPLKCLKYEITVELVVKH